MSRLMHSLSGKVVSIMRGNINFYKGEVKRIEAVVTPRNPDELVVINKAHYRLLRLNTGETVEDGELDIDKDTVSTILGIDEAGLFELKITVTVGKETFIEKALVRTES